MRYLALTRCTQKAPHCLAGGGRTRPVSLLNFRTQARTLTSYNNAFQRDYCLLQSKIPYISTTSTARSSPLFLVSYFQYQPKRQFFETESSYHTIADETLEEIQDAVEIALEETDDIEGYEISLASGVLTMSLPPHGTYVINKQTPNQQLWWSSPLSGPRRYEYAGEEDESLTWVCSKDDSLLLGESLRQELKQLFDLDVDLEVP